MHFWVFLLLSTTKMVLNVSLKSCKVSFANLIQSELSEQTHCCTQTKKTALQILIRKFNLD